MTDIPQKMVDVKVSYPELLVFEDVDTRWTVLTNDLCYPFEGVHLQCILTDPSSLHIVKPFGSSSTRRSSKSSADKSDAIRLKPS